MVPFRDEQQLHFFDTENVFLFLHIEISNGCMAVFLLVYKAFYDK
jgi:hypothetical protein